MSAALKTGATVPPLLAVHAWTETGYERREVRFFPFIPRDHLKDRPLSQNTDHPRASYRMFEYVRMNELPYFRLLQSPPHEA